MLFARRPGLVSNYPTHGHTEVAELVSMRLSIDPEYLAGPALVAAGMAKDMGDQLALELPNHLVVDVRFTGLQQLFDPVAEFTSGRFVCSRTRPLGDRTGR